MIKLRKNFQMGIQVTFSTNLDSAKFEHWGHRWAVAAPRATQGVPSPDRRRRSLASPRRRHRLSLTSSEDGDQQITRRLVTASAASAFRPPCSAAPVLPPSRYVILLS